MSRYIYAITGFASVCSQVLAFILMTAPCWIGGAIAPALVLQREQVGSAVLPRSHLVTCPSPPSCSKVWEKIKDNEAISYSTIRYQGQKLLTC